MSERWKVETCYREPGETWSETWWRAYKGDDNFERPTWAEVLAYANQKARAGEGPSMTAFAPFILACDPAVEGSGVTFVKLGQTYGPVEPRRRLDPAAVLAAITAHGGSETGGNLHGGGGSET